MIDRLLIGYQLKQYTMWYLYIMKFELLGVFSSEVPTVRQVFVIVLLLNMEVLSFPRARIQIEEHISVMNNKFYQSNGFTIFTS